MKIDALFVLENCILVELYRRHARVTYLTTESGFEVDFVAQYPDGSVEVIQVSADLSDPETREREYRALSDTGSAWPQPVNLQAYGLGQDALLNKAYVPQIAEISTSTSLGNLETSTVSRAGAPSPK